MRETRLQTPRSIKKFSRSWSRDSPTACGEDHDQASPREEHSEADIHPAALGGPQTAAGGQELKETAIYGDLLPKQAPGRSCSLWRGAQATACF